MYTYKHAERVKQYMAGIFVAAFLLMFGGYVSFAHAELISDQQVETQKKEVLIQIVQVLEQDVKLLQMILIQNLEARVIYLQTLVANK